MASAVRTSLKKGPWPHTTIGCQELLNTEDVSYSGMLKKQVSYPRKKLSLIGTLLRKLPWVDRYIVLSNGSLYHYTDHQAKKPNGAYSLFGYNQVVRAGDIPHGRYPWAFKIVHMTDVNKAKYFCSGSEREIKIWMREIRAQLVIANGSLLSQSHLSLKVNDDDLEKPIYDSSDEIIMEVTKQKMKNGMKNGHLNDDSDDDDDDDDYLEIDEDILEHGDAGDRSSRPLPPVPNEQKKVSRNNSNLPSIEERPKILNLMNNDSYGEDDGHIHMNKPLPVTPTEVTPIHDRKRLPIPGESNDIENEQSTSRMGTQFRKPVPLPPKSGNKGSPPHPDKPTPLPDKPAPGKKPIGVKVFPGGLSPKNHPPSVGMKPQLVHQSTSSQEEQMSPVRRVLPEPPPRARKNQSPTTAINTADCQLIRWSDVYWDGADKQACEQIITNIGVEGVYMVRESDKPGCVKTLVCYAEDKTRKFMIKQNAADGSYFLNLNSSFPSIIALLEHYHHNNLPSRNTKLLEPFTKHTRDSL